MCPVVADFNDGTMRASPTEPQGIRIMGLATYLTFNGNCEKAMMFYAHALGTQINELHRFSDMPGDEIPADFGDKVMHANLTFQGCVLMGSDAPPGTGFDGTHCGFSVSVNVASVEQAETVFAALSDGGNVTMPIGETFWAKRFGMLVDQFGVAWMVNCENSGDISY